jgi:SAM-dependent methyltransferase
MNDRYRDGGYLASNPDWHAADSPWKAARIKEFLDSRQLQPATVLELGCGAGEVLKQLSEAWPAAQLTGCEISPQAFAECRKKAGERLRFELLQPGAVPGGHFDLAMAIDVFEHVADYWGFLSTMRPLADYKLFHIPLDLSVLTVARSGSLMRKRHGVGHLHYFTTETALATLRDCGYDIIASQYTRGSIELPNQHWSGKLLKLPRMGLFALNQGFAARLLGGFSLLVLAR